MNDGSKAIRFALDEKTVATLRSVDATARSLQTPYLVIGATARDLVLHHLHGLPRLRATHDIDFAIQTESWHRYEAIVSALGAHGFERSRTIHRLIGPDRQQIDIVPFGPIETEESIIAWPSDGSIRMNVAGFDDALRDALWILAHDEPVLNVPVVSPEGFVVLKLFAWSDRSGTRGEADARDIAHVVTSQEHIPDYRTLVFESDHLSTTESYDWDVGLASAHLFGARARAMSSSATVARIIESFRLPEHVHTRERLVRETHTTMHHGRADDGTLSWLDAFLTGYGASEAD